MTIADVVKILDGKLMAGDGTSPRAVGAVVANDLMSDVLLNDADDILLLTSLASDQAIRTGEAALRDDAEGGRRPRRAARLEPPLEV